MSEVYIGNPTEQHRSLSYRLPQHKTIRTVPIPAGGQAKLPDDLDGAELTSVIAQFETLGAVPKGDIRSIVYPKTLIYEVSAKPINADVLQEALEKDLEARQEVAAVKMEEAGLQAFQNANKLTPGKVVETSIEIVAVNDRGVVANDVDMEVVVSSKPSRRAGKQRTTDKNTKR